MNLNEQQEAVNRWTRYGKGSLNLIARAGCGKTFTLVRGVIATIVEENLGSVSLMAYNKSAAEEFKTRLADLAKESGNPRFTQTRFVDAGTVHSFGFRAVRYWTSNRVKVNDKKCQAIVNALSTERDDVYDRESGPILKLVSLAKQSAFGFSTGIDDKHAWFELAEYHGVNDLVEFPLDDVVRASQKVLTLSAKRDKEEIDFDDMILAPLVHNLKVWQTDWVLIDEAQDTNPARRALALKMMRPKSGRLVAVGDDRQAIYGFTGADHDSLEQIAEALDSQTLPLTITYRCPKAVVAEANRLVPDLVAHESAPDGIVRYRSRLIPPSVDSNGETGNGPTIPWFTMEKLTEDDVVLCRNTAPLVETAYAMLSRGIGCRIEGREIGEGLIRLATRWRRVETLGLLSSKLDDYLDREVQKWQAKGKEDRAQAAEDKVQALKVMIGSLTADGKTKVSDLVSFIRRIFGDVKPGQTARVVTLSTIHKAKGREWERVFFLDRSSTLPSPYARKPWQKLQEENLEYVAITRAKHELVFVD